MKLKKQIKIYLLGLISISLISANLNIKNNIENEAQKLFNGIPIQEGIASIIKNSKYKFDYGKSIYTLGSHETWFTEINEFNYLDSPIKKINLELGQGSEEKEMGCYNSSLRLFYDDEETRTEEFFKIKKNFEKLGEKVDTETVMTEDYIMKSQTVIVYFKKGQLIPNLEFSFRQDESDIDYQIFIRYQNCLNQMKNK